MGIILFDMFPATGHYHASFRLAEKLAKENRVVYLCEPSYQKLIESNGFETILLDEKIIFLQFVEKESPLLFKAFLRVYISIYQEQINGNYTGL